MNKYWDVTTLGDAYDVRDGTHDSPKYQPEGYALVTSKNLKKDGLNMDKVSYISEEDFQKINERSAVSAGDVLLAMIGTIGNPIVVETKPGFAIKNVALFKVPHDKDSFFLKYYLETQYVQKKMQKEARGATQKFVGLGYLRNFPTSIPSLSEQKRIVAILDEAFAGIDAAIANTKKNLVNARELFESYLSSVFTKRGEGWVRTTLDELCEKVEYGSSSKSKPAGSIPVIRMGNIQNGRIDWDKLVYTDNAEEIKKYLLKKNDVLFNRTNSPELVGKSAIYTGETPAIFAGYLIRLHRKEHLIDADFLNYYLNSTAAREYGKTVMSSSVNQANINGTKLKKYPLSAPDIEEQKSIVIKLQDLEEKTKYLESIYQRKLNSLNELKQSLLQKAFSGELTVADESRKQAAVV